ncbi:galactose oxidase-like domain-containing protein [Streptomyces vinaceus]|uniref:galactose oxidase-like domain-containing protein n=1 Tax=Streptomyces vinaceus TaxID=1960 RepID=UPI0036CAD054
MPRGARPPNSDPPLTPPRAGAPPPPGYYMLFLLDAKGVPSTAKWVKLGGRR